jgi:colanic acid biosynthesis glycosyl transferase WcaI
MNRVYPPVRGATGRVLQDLARAFANEGWHVTVVTTGPQKIQERDGAVRVIRVKAPERPPHVFSYMWIWMKMLMAVLRLKSRHLVVTMSDPPLLIVAGQIVARFKKCRHINWCHDLYPDVMPSLGFKVPIFLMNIFKSMSRRAMEKCDKVIVSGRCMARVLSLDGVSATQIAMIPNWPDMELIDTANAEPVHYQSFHPMNIRGARPYEQQIKDRQRFRILYAGNIGRAHPVDTIIEAANILEQEGSDVEFVFVGDGSRFDDLAKRRTDLGLSNIRFLPYQPLSRLRELMESGDLHLISMSQEAAGYLVPSKLYAALAVARPCIMVGPEQSEVAKVITDFKAGVVVPQGDAQGLANAIKRYRHSGEDWFAAHNGAAQAGEVFQPEFSIEAWMGRAWDAIKNELSQK